MHNCGNTNRGNYTAPTNCQQITKQNVFLENNVCVCVLNGCGYLLCGRAHCPFVCVHVYIPPTFSRFPQYSSTPKVQLPGYSTAYGVSVPAFPRRPFCAINVTLVFFFSILVCSCIISLSCVYDSGMWGKGEMTGHEKTSRGLGPSFTEITYPPFSCKATSFEHQRCEGKMPAWN